MDVYTMVALIVVVSCGAGVLNNYFKMKGSMSDEEDQAVAQGELDELRERIEVLEKIVTDDKYQLRNELADLERTGS